MRIHEIQQDKRLRLETRFEELGIEAATQYFIDWIYMGAFNLPYSKLDRFEASFYLINSVLPPEIIQSYGKLPILYRGMSFSPQKIKQIQLGGLPIKSRIMAWTPYKEQAIEYVLGTSESGVVLKHKPKAKEVLLSLTPETLKFLGVSNLFVSNKGETILSLPILTVTPEIVEKIIT